MPAANLSAFGQARCSDSGLVNCYRIFRGTQRGGCKAHARMLRAAGLSGRNNVDYAQTVTRRARILIVEDDVDLRRMFRQALTFAGFDVNEAGDGMEALRSIDRDAPDAVILDIGLPLLSGNVVRQEIAAQAHTRHIPVIVVTGQPGEHEGPGAACVLRKPVSADRLIQTVRTCIASAGTTFSAR